MIRRASRLLVLMGPVLFLVSGCGGADPRQTVPVEPPSSAPSTSAVARDNTTLSPKQLMEATSDALSQADTFHARHTGKNSDGPIDVEVEWGFSDTYLEGTLGGGSVTAIAGGQRLLLKFTTLPGFSAAESNALNQRLRGRWINFVRQDLNDVRMIFEVLRRVSLARAVGDELGAPRQGPSGSISGVRTVSYRFSDGTVVHVPAAGAPLPLRVDTNKGSTTYSDYGTPVEIEIPEPSQVVTLADLRNE